MTALTLSVSVISIVTVASFLRSFFGFGLALVAMPFLALLIDLKTATPLAALLGTTIGLLILLRSWRDIDLSAAWRLILSSLIGIPIGLYVLKTAPDALIKGVLGLTIILFALYRLAQPHLLALKQPRWIYFFGLIAGVMGGAYNTSGPPLILYGALRRWSPPRFRATMQGYFFPTGLFIALGHSLTGFWTPQVMQFYTLSLPLVLIAFWLGEKYNRRIPENRFEQLLYLALIVVGGLLFF